MRPGNAAAVLPADVARAEPSIEEIWTWLGEVADPEIPVISVVDLGIVREVRWENEAHDRRLVVTVTPTYSGCPATAMISSDIVTALQQRGIDNVQIETRLSPPWSSDWLSETGKKKLHGYGIAPPAQPAGRVFPLRIVEASAPVISCPHCGSNNTAKISEFGSTPCKAQYRCRDCLEPFDYFKCI